MDLNLQLARDLDVLEDAATNYVKNRKATIELLHSLADDLEKHHANSRIVKVVGSSTGIVASGLVIGGFVASFFTFGASLVVAGVGAGLGAAAGLTTVGGFATQMITSRLTQAGAQKILIHDKIAYDNLKAALDRLDSTWKALRDAGRIVLGVASGGKQIFNVVDSVYDLVRVGSLALQAGEATAQTAFKTLSAVGRGMAIAGVVFSVVAIPLDLHTMITSAKDIHKKTVPAVAQAIRAVVDEMVCPSEEEMQSNLSRIRNALRVQ